MLIITSRSRRLIRGLGRYEYLRPLYTLPTGVTFNPDTGGFDGAPFTTREADSPANGTVRSVTPGMDHAQVQAVLDACVAGDRVQWEAGGTWQLATALIPPRGNGANPAAWNWFTTSGSLPPEGTRMTPALAAAYGLPKLISPDNAPSNNQVFLADQTPGAGAAKYLRIRGLELTCGTVGAPNGSYGLVEFGPNDTTAVANLPSYCWTDRCYIHGQPSASMRRGITMHGQFLAAIDNWIDEIHWGTYADTNGDSQAIALWQGTGPHVIDHNFLSAAQELMASGGGDPLHEQVTINDVLVRRNHFYRPLSWKGLFPVKNGVEMKQGQRWLYLDNIIENVWLDAQSGEGFMFWSVNQLGTCPWMVTRDITVRHTLVKNANMALELSSNSAATSIPASRLDFANVLWTGLGGASSYSPANHPSLPNNAGTRKVILLNNIDADNILSDVSLSHLTAFMSAGYVMNPSNNLVMPRLRVKNSLLGEGTIFTSNGQGVAAWTEVAGTDSEFAGNVLLDTGGTALPNAAQNAKAASIAAIKLAGGDAAELSEASAIADMALAADSPYKAATWGLTTDGADPGADTNLLASRLAGVAGL